MSNNNKTFFMRAEKGNVSLGDIFSDIAIRHSSQEMASVLTAGTALTTPEEADILKAWQRPFLFARFFVSYMAFLVVSYFLGSLLGHMGGYYLLMVGVPFLVPVTLLLLVWEMNIPRNISLYEVISMAAVGGLLSIVATVVISNYVSPEMAAWAGLVEEPAKLILIYLYLRKKNYRFALNGALIGAAVGTGFAIIESIVYTFTYLEQGILAALMAVSVDGTSLLEILETFPAIWAVGVGNGLGTAVARACTAISGHGIFAALYGFALVKAKGKEELNPSHLVNPTFLAYFGISILLHALHNYGVDLGLPVVFGFLRCEYLVIALIALGLLASVLRTGVNQVISIGIRHHGHSFTRAVVYDEPSHQGGVYTPDPAPVASAVREVKLYCDAGPHKGERFKCREGKSFTIGRDQGRNDVCVSQCKHVSGTHCRVDFNGGRVTVTDLGSRNGTYVNGLKLGPNESVTAMDGSLLKLADDNCQFRIQIR